MAYATKTREMVFEYLAKGHTYEETRKELGVAVSTKLETIRTKQVR
jgi:hypothetical protein